MKINPSQTTHTHTHNMSIRTHTYTCAHTHTHKHIHTNGQHTHTQHIQSVYHCRELQRVTQPAYCTRAEEDHGAASVSEACPPPRRDWCCTEAASSSSPPSSSLLAGLVAILNCHWLRVTPPTPHPVGRGLCSITLCCLVPVSLKTGIQPWLPCCLPPPLSLGPSYTAS